MLTNTTIKEKITTPAATVQITDHLLYVVNKCIVTKYIKAEKGTLTTEKWS
jgi:hypothetical protein